MARPKRIKIYLNGQEVGTGVLSEDEKTVESIRLHNHIPEEDRERILHDRELKVRERRERG
jgi:hypothetical protein